MKLIHKETSGPDPQRNIFLLCVFRDERLLLEYFVRYYQSLGVTHFIFVDNLSTDDGPQFLRNLRNINLMLYTAPESYRDAGYGTAWINQLLNEHCLGQYCFTVDVDELFVMDSSKYSSLQHMTECMDSANANAIPATLLDMYPEATNNRYYAGSDFLQHSKYFDDFNTDFYEDWRPIYGSFSHKVGGVRRRVLETTVCIHKFPFIKFDFHPIGIATGCHFFQQEGNVLFSSDKIRLFPAPTVLLHFKFIKPNFKEFVRKRIELDQDWNGSVEYRRYLEALGDGGALVLLHPRYSRRLDTIRDLESFM